MLIIPAFQFECGIKGKSQVTWYKNGELIRSNEYFVINDNRLNIYGLIRDDQAVYQCFAENEIGNVQASVQLLIYEAGMFVIRMDVSISSIFPISS